MAFKEGFDSEHLLNRETEKAATEYYRLFADVSGGGVKDIEAAIRLFRSAKVDMDDAFASASSIRQHLIDQGFEYDAKTFSLKEMLQKKKGNCLGLSLLFGAELKRRGFDPSFEIISNPMDKTHELDLRFFEELSRGEYFPFDKPLLANRRADVPEGRFAAVEHPVLVLGDKRFETTSLDPDDDPGLVPKAESVKPVGFSEVASTVLVDRAKGMARSGMRWEDVRALSARAVELWPENSDAWAFMFEQAFHSGDTEHADMARMRHGQIGGSDSRYYLARFQMTGDVSMLDEALKRFPADAQAFTMRHVVLEPKVLDARFNLAVASNCVANSEILDLGSFYEMFGKEVIRLYGEDQLKKLLKKLAKLGKG